MAKGLADLAELLARFICATLRGLTWFNAFREKYKTRGFFVTTLLGVLIGVFCVWMVSGHPLVWDWQPTSWTSKLTGKAVLSLFGSFFLNQFILRSIALIAAVGGHSLVLAEMGLVDAVGPSEKYTDIVAKYRSSHKEGENIRVICMAGRRVFRKKVSPLYNDYLEGRLEVIAPDPDVNGPSFKVRSSMAPEDERADITPQSLTDSTQASIEALKKRGCKVFLHSQICIWRVVLFSEHCVVQSYLPNLGEEGHMKEPTLVFARGPEGSMYKTFSSMFEALKSEATEA